MYGDKSVRDLEEDLAEGFREYVMTREEKGILNKIKNFFKSLFIKIKYWSSFKPHIYSYYKNINNGRYANRALSENIVKALYYQEQYTQEMQEIKDKAIANGTFMKASNGKPTNLTDERQWIHVRTKAFKNWFGDWTKITFDKEGKILTIPNDVSKVVDENGEPLVVYHGTNWDFTTFNKETRGNTTGASSAKLAFFAASNFRNAEEYLLSEDERYVDFINSRGEYYTYDRLHTTVSQNQEDIIVAIYKKEQELWKQPLFQIDELKNLYGEGYILEELLYNENLKEKYPEAAKKYKEETQKIEDSMTLKYNPHVKAVFLNIKNIRETDDKGAKFSAGSYTKTIQKAQEENRDGGVIKNTKDPVDTDVYYFFEPNQIKSATDNIGTYSRENNDTRYRKASYSFNTLPQEVQQSLIKKGWNQELFDSISEKEKEIAVTCAGL
jgi:hypothetical protein